MWRAFVGAAFHPLGNSLDLLIAECEGTCKSPAAAVGRDRPWRHDARSGIGRHGGCVGFGSREVVQSERRAAAVLMALQAVILKDGRDVVVVRQRSICRGSGFSGLSAAAACDPQNEH